MSIMERHDHRVEIERLQHAELRRDLMKHESDVMKACVDDRDREICRLREMIYGLGLDPDAGRK